METEEDWYSDELKIQENQPLLGTKGRSIFPKEAVEAETGKKTFDVGYGHKLSSAESKNKKVYGIDISKGITEEEATQILLKDIKKHEAIAKKAIGTKTWNSLNMAGQKLLTDYSFNGVLGKFKNFKTAIRNKDKEGVLKEYVRKWRDPDQGGALVPMKERNIFGLELIEEMIKDW